MTKALVAIAVAVAVLLTGAACKPDGRHAAPPPAPGKHRVQPMPQPDPAPSRSGIGNVQITIWVELDNDRATVTYNVGQGNKTVIGRRPGSHWDLSVQPGQLVAVVVSHFNGGESGRLFVQVVQNNNGRILCQDENTGDRAAGLVCNGVVVI